MLEGCTGQKVAAKRPTLFVIPSLKMGCHHCTGTGKFLISTSLTKINILQLRFLKDSG